jgi:hypothetical protein
VSAAVLHERGSQSAERLVKHYSYDRWGNADKNVLYDQRLSLDAKAIYTIIINVWERAGEHQFNSESIKKYTKESVGHIEKCLCELELAGYLGSAG